MEHASNIKESGTESDGALSLDQSVVSVSGKRIRLTRERWAHIEKRHPELRLSRDKVLETVRDPNLVFPGRYHELLAVRSYEMAGRDAFVVVVYRESSKDGFIITAFLSSDITGLERREKLWPSLF